MRTRSCSYCIHIHTHTHTHGSTDRFLGESSVFTDAQFLGESSVFTDAQFLGESSVFRKKQEHRKKLDGSSVFREVHILLRG